MFPKRMIESNVNIYQKIYEKQHSNMNVPSKKSSWVFNEVSEPYQKRLENIWKTHVSSKLSGFFVSLQELRESAHQIAALAPVRMETYFTGKRMENIKKIKNWF